MREFAKGVAQHIVGWMIVRALLDRLVKHYVANDDWDREKKDIAVKVVAELESVDGGGDLHLHSPAVENIARKIHTALCGSDAFRLMRENRSGFQTEVTEERFTDACRVGFETVIDEARAGSHLPGESDEPY